MNIRQIYESVITEGKHWPEDYKKTALNMIKSSPLGQASWYSDSYQKQDVDTIADEFSPLSHKNSNLGYFSPIIRWFIEYSGTDSKKYQEFIERKLDRIIQTLLYLSNNSSEESKIKDNLKTKWKFADFEEYADKIQSQIDAEQKEKSKNVSLVDKGYEIIPIYSYEELHEKFGGNKTGYKGDSEWCHTNGDSTYDSWTSNGTKMFFVLAKKDWKKIKPPDPKTTNAYDDYGTSLIAILVNVSDNKLLNATLRWNHIIEPSKTVQGTSVDKAFLGWADLAEVTGRNVEKEISEMISSEREKLEKETEAANENTIKLLHGLKRIDSNTLNDVAHSVTKINIPNSVTSIGDYAFYTCDKLTLVSIPDSVKFIGNAAFQDCESLTSITIPNSVTSIGDSAFCGCSELTSIEIPNSIKSIGEEAFEDCNQLVSITIPNSVTSIGVGAFNSCSRLTSITIPNSVKSIGEGAFSYCNGLTSITIPNSVKSIGDGVFSGCTGLTSITIPNSVTSIGRYTFSDCTGLTSITIPNSVTSLGRGAFSGCTGLTSITIPNSVTSIGDWAFGYCNGLTSVTIPNSVTSIGKYVFYKCNPNIIVTVSKDFDRSLLKDVRLPETAKFRIIY